MHPVLLDIPFLGGIKLYTYGLMAALGFVAALSWISREAKREGISPDVMMDLAFLMMVTAIVGSRLLFILMNLQTYLADPLAIFKIWQGGLVWYGGLIPCIFIAFRFVRRHHLSFALVADLFAPAISIGHVFGRLGCLAAGCCFGRVASASHFWTITFPNRPFTLAPVGVPLYATQAYEFLGELGLFLFLVVWRRRRHFAGELILLYLAGYSLLRTGVEFFRGDLPRGVGGLAWLSTTQVLSFILMASALSLLMRGWIKRRSS